MQQFTDAVSALNEAIENTKSAVADAHALVTEGHLDVTVAADLVSHMTTSLSAHATGRLASVVEDAQAARAAAAVNDATGALFDPMATPLTGTPHGDNPAAGTVPDLDDPADVDASFEAIVNGAFDSDNSPADTADDASDPVGGPGPVELDPMTVPLAADGPAPVIHTGVADEINAAAAGPGGPRIHRVTVEGHGDLMIGAADYDTVATEVARVLASMSHGMFTIGSPVDATDGVLTFRYTEPADLADLTGGAVPPADLPMMGVHPVDGVGDVLVWGVIEGGPLDAVTPGDLDAAFAAASAYRVANLGDDDFAATIGDLAVDAAVPVDALVMLFWRSDGDVIDGGRIDEVVDLAVERLRPLIGDVTVTGRTTDDDGLSWQAVLAVPDPAAQRTLGRVLIENDGIAGETTFDGLGTVRVTGMPLMV